MNKQIIQITKKLKDKAGSLTFDDPVAYVYNPLEYAFAPLEKYIKKYASKKTTLLVGMNPGPFGMAQTGVPFGDIKMVSDFLQITGSVKKPEKEHPKRQIEGFNCKRSEVSGTRLWNFVKSEFGTADNFFNKFFVVNYCPLIFMTDTGRNITPDKLPISEQKVLFDICDEALLKTVDCMDSTTVVGIGGFAEKACIRALKERDIQIKRILHPSPASPAANRGWAEQAKKQLKDFNLI
jgi:single-strand selective monofunctional uracil DNA glycosylase